MQAIWCRNCLYPPNTSQLWPMGHNSTISQQESVAPQDTVQWQCHTMWLSVATMEPQFIGTLMPYLLTRLPRPWATMSLSKAASSIPNWLTPTYLELATNWSLISQRFVKIATHLWLPALWQELNDTGHTNNSQITAHSRKPPSCVPWFGPIHRPWRPPLPCSTEYRLDRKSVV